MHNFKELIGQTITVLLVNETKALGLTIRGVEDGGLWVESSEMNEALRRATTLETVGLHPIVFFPFAQIRFAWYPAPEPQPAQIPVV